MEGNLLYKDYNIFTKTPHIFLNLNTTITKNLNVLQDVNITNNLNVSEQTIIYKNLNVLQNLNISNDLIVYKNANISKYLNVENANISKYLNVENINLSDTLYANKNIIVSKDSHFKANLDIYGNLTVYGSKVNIISEQTLISDPLIVFGTNQSKSTIDNHYGGFVIAHKNKFSGLLRKPNSSNFYLYRDINQISDNEPDLSSLSNLGDLYIYNLNSTYININTGSISDLTISNTFINNKHTTLYNNVNIHANDPIFHKNINIYGNSIINQNTMIKKNLNVSETSILNKSIINELIINNNLIANNTHSRFQNVTINGNNIINANLNVLQNINVTDTVFTKDITVSGNLIVSGNHALIITNHLDINDPIITIANTKNDTRDRGLLIAKKISNYTGLIRKDTDENFYLLDNISDPYSTSLPTSSKSTLILKNINTSSNSIINGTTFIANNDITNKDDIIATFPNNTSTENIDFYKSTNFHKNMTVNSNINLLGNLSVKDQFTLLDTNSFVSRGHSDFYGNTNLYGPTHISGLIDFKHTTLTFDHLNVRSYIHSDNTIQTKNQHISSILQIPVKTNNSFNKPGSIYFNTTSNLYEAFNNSQWLPMGGINPYKDTTITNNLNVDMNLNIIQNINCTDTLTTHTAYISNCLKVPVATSNPHNIPGSIYFNTTSNLYEAFNNSQWLPMGGINPYSDTTITNNLNIDMNLNVLQNLNCTDTITSSKNTIIDNLLIPKHNGLNPKLSNIQGSIYFNTTENMYEGFVGGSEGWAPLGGFSKNKDAIIHKNLFVLKNLNITQNINCNDTITSNTNIINNLLQIPISTTINNTNNKALYIYNTNTATDNLMIGSNKVAYDNNITQLSVSTDLFQFYNVQKNSPIFGNRITGLNDPTMNTFSKYYTIKEYTFFQQTTISHIEFYISHSIHNTSAVPQSFKITIKKNGINTSVADKYYDNIVVGSVVSNQSLGATTLVFNSTDTVSIQLTLNNTNNDFNGHEIFARLYGHTQISPQINNLKLTSINNYNATPPALEVSGGATFGGSVKVGETVLTFTGSHVAKIISPLNYESFYTNNDNYNYTFKPGLIVSISNSTKIDINNSEFNTILSNKINDSTVFGVISKHTHSNNYIINSLGEGAIWVSNITGDIQNGDYISTSTILGYGCKQHTSTLHNYTVAKCCSVINWTSISTYINTNNQQYKIAFIACTYHCG